MRTGTVLYTLLNTGLYTLQGYLKPDPEIPDGGSRSLRGGTL